MCGNEKLYTTEEISELLDCTTSVIRNIVSYYHIPCEYMIHRRAFFSWNAYLKIKERHEARRNNKLQQIISARPEMTVEEIARLEDHSLVTDKRCLNLNWWPETIPSCFQEVEEND